MNQTVIRIPTFHAGQREIWKKRGKRNAVRCGRRFGKTKKIVTLACDGAARGLKVGIFAPENKQLDEPFDEILDILNPIVASSNRSKGTIKLKQGGKIDFWQLTDNELAGRGREYDIILIDEAAFTKNGQMINIWNKSLVPTMATKPNASVWVFSTPNGEDTENFFYKVCSDPEMEFVEHYAPSSVNPLVSTEWLENEKNRLHPDVYRQELLAEWVDWKGIAFFDINKWLDDNGLPIADPVNCDTVYAVIDSAVKTGQKNDGTAVIYLGRNKYAGVPLFIIDWDVIQIEGASLSIWLDSVFNNLETYAKRFKAREGVRGVWVEDKASGSILLQQARSRGNVYPIGGAWLTVGKDERALAVSSYHYQGNTKILAGAYDKVSLYKGGTRNHLVSQVTSFRLGDPDAAKRADDILDAYVHSLELTFGDGKRTG